MRRTTRFPQPRSASHVMRLEYRRFRGDCTKMTDVFADIRDVDDCHLAARDRAVELSAMDLRSSAAQRLASLGEMTSGIVHDLVNVLSVIDVGLQLAELNAE